MISKKTISGEGTTLEKLEGSSQNPQVPQYVRVLAPSPWWPGPAQLAVLSIEVLGE